MRLAVIALLVAAFALDVSFAKDSSPQLEERIQELERGVFWKKPLTWRHKDALGSMADVLRAPRDERWSSMWWSQMIRGRNEVGRLLSGPIAPSLRWNDGGGGEELMAAIDELRAAHTSSFIISAKLRGQHTKLLLKFADGLEQGRIREIRGIYDEWRALLAERK